MVSAQRWSDVSIMHAPRALTGCPVGRGSLRRPVMRGRGPSPAMLAVICDRRSEAVRSDRELDVSAVFRRGPASGAPGLVARSRSTLRADRRKLWRQR